MESFPLECYFGLMARRLFRFVCIVVRTNHLSIFDRLMISDRSRRVVAWFTARPTLAGAFDRTKQYLLDSYVYLIIARTIFKPAQNIKKVDKTTYQYIIRFFFLLSIEATRIARANYYCSPFTKKINLILLSIFNGLFG